MVRRKVSGGGRVLRRNRRTWEVAKGKLEPGETPEAAAIREVGEELGIDVPLRVERFVGVIRYGFHTPNSGPRLKSVYLYLLDSDAPIESFSPATDEGIVDISWFSVEEARRAVVHPSLRPAMRRVQHLLTA